MLAVAACDYRRVRRVALVAAIVLLAASCGKFGRTTGSGTPQPVASTKVGQGIVFVTASPVPGNGKVGSAGTTATPAPVFVLHILDQNNNHPFGIPVRFDGPVHRTLESDASGAVRFAAPEGTYSLHIDKGCHPALVITQGVIGTIHLYANAPRSADVRVGWQHRFGPSGVASSDAPGDWTTGSPVHIRYDVIDRCQNEIAPNASFPTFRFRPSANVSLVGVQALASDGSGRGTVTAKCTKPGDMQLVLIDTANPQDHADRLGEASGFNGRPRCAAK